MQSHHTSNRAYEMEKKSFYEAKGSEQFVRNSYVLIENKYQYVMIAIVTRFEMKLFFK